MGERFTNNHLDFLEQIKVELISPVHGGINSQTKAIFLQFSELPVDRTAIHYLKGEQSKLIIKQWDNQFDKERFSLGIYNLDRIAVNEYIIDLSDTQVKQLDKLITVQHPIGEFHGIILDGYSFTLKLWDSTGKKNNLEWRHESQISKATQEFVSVLKQMAGI